MAELDPSTFQLNAKLFTDSGLQYMMQLNNGQMIDAQSSRRRQDLIGDAALVKGLELLYTVDPAEARGLRSLAQGEAVDTTATGTILAAMAQVAVKAAQTTRPETGAG